MKNNKSGEETKLRSENNVYCMTVKLHESSFTRAGLRSDGKHKSQVSVVPARPREVEAGDVEDEDFRGHRMRAKARRRASKRSQCPPRSRITDSSGSGTTQSDTFALRLVVPTLCQL